MNLGLEGRVCVVTGGTRGIGAATARMLSQEGARVLTVARHGADLELDVTAPDAGERAARRRAPEPPWALVNNAGTSQARALEDLTDADWQEQWELHVMAPMRLMRALAPAMADAGGGRVVNVSSSSGQAPLGPARRVLFGHEGRGAFAQPGVRRRVRRSRRARERSHPGRGRGRALDAEGGLADQIAARTGSTREEVLAATRSSPPLGRMGTDDEVAAVITFLCSERASNVTGAAWAVDGGSVPTA